MINSSKYLTFNAIIDNSSMIENGDYKYWKNIYHINSNLYYIFIKELQSDIDTLIEVHTRVPILLFFYNKVISSYLDQ